MLINCAVYGNGRKLAEIEIDEIAGYLAQPGCFVWVALREPDAAELEAMRVQFDLHPLAVEDARHGHQRPKLEEYGDSLFAVMHTVEPDGGELRIGEMNVFVGPNYVLSVRNRSERGFADVRTRCEREPELLRHGSGYVLYALMDAVVDRYFPVLDALEDELEALERSIFAGAAQRASIERLYHLKLRLTDLKHAAGPLTEVAGKLFGGRVPVLCANLQDYFRDVYDHLVRLSQTIDATRDMVSTAVSVNLSLIQLSENDVTKRLAACAALVAVPTMIAGIYGMNFDHMPELRSPWGYPAVLGAMAAIDGWLYWRFRRAGWL